MPLVAGEPGCICVDGRLLAPAHATVSALDAGFLLGDGVFESLRATGGHPYLLDRHLRRLHAGAAELGFQGVPSPERLTALVHETLARAQLDDAYLRITVTRGVGAAPALSPAASPTVVIAALPAPAVPDAGEGVDVALLGPPSQRGPTAKSTSRQSAVMARRQAERAGAVEGIYVCARGRVLDGASANVFALSGGRLLTPPAEDCLPGVTRGRVLELALAAGIDAVQAPLPVEALLGAEEAFLTNAVQGLRAIARVDGRPLTPEGRVLASSGGVFATLSALYESDRSLAAPARRAAVS